MLLEALAKISLCCDRYVGIAVGLTDILLGSLGNLLTIIVFSRSSSLRVSFNIFILNLAVIDLITSTLMMPLQVAGYVQMNWLVLHSVVLSYYVLVEKLKSRLHIKVGHNLSNAVEMRQL